MNAPTRFADPSLPRHDWALDEVEALFDLPFTELVFRAASAITASAAISLEAARPVSKWEDWLQ